MAFNFFLWEEDHNKRMDRLEIKALNRGLSQREAREFRRDVSDFAKAKLLHRIVKARVAAHEAWLKDGKRVQEDRVFDLTRKAAAGMRPDPAEVLERMNRECAMALLEHQTAFFCSECNPGPIRCPHVQSAQAAGIR